VCVLSLNAGSFLPGILFFLTNLPSAQTTLTFQQLSRGRLLPFRENPWRHGERSVLLRSSAREPLVPARHARIACAARVRLAQRSPRCCACQRCGGITVSDKRQAMLHLQLFSLFCSTAAASRYRCDYDVSNAQVAESQAVYCVPMAVCCASIELDPLVLTHWNLSTELWFTYLVSTKIVFASISKFSNRKSISRNTARL